MDTDLAARRARLFTMFRHQNIAHSIARRHCADRGGRDLDAEAELLRQHALRSWQAPTPGAPQPQEAGERPLQFRARGAGKGLRPA